MDYIRYIGKDIYDFFRNVIIITALLLYALLNGIVHTLGKIWEWVDGLALTLCLMALVFCVGIVASVYDINSKIDEYNTDGYRDVKTYLFKDNHGVCYTGLTITNPDSLAVVDCSLIKKQK